MLDASSTLSWCFPQEKTPQAEALFRRAQDAEILVPAIWPLEVSHVIRRALREERIDQADVDAFLSHLATLDFQVDISIYTVPDALLQVEYFGLTSYDASYLALAERRGVPLATNDQRMQKAALRAGVALL